MSKRSDAKARLSTYDLALRLLGFRARSVAEMRRLLLARGQDALSIEEVIARLSDQKLLDDADFALQFARARLQAAGTSRRRIVQELARKGVARDLAERAIEELRESDGLDPGVAVARVAEKKWRSLAGLDAFTRRRRLYAFLARRGFDSDEIRSVMNVFGEDIDR